MLAASLHAVTECGERQDQLVMLRAPNQRDAGDYECERVPQEVRLIRHVAPNGQIRVMMTNLLDSEIFPASAFSGLYHKRWRIEKPSKD